MPTALDYRPAMTPARGRILRLLRQRDTMHKVAAVFKLILGVTLSFLAPFLLASIVCSAASRVARADLSWLRAFTVTTIALIPLLYWLEHRTRGKFFEDEAHAIAMDHGERPSSHGEWMYRSDRATWALYIEVFFLAPRMTFEGPADLRSMRHLGAANMGRAADLIELFLAGEGSFAAAKLRHPIDDPRDFALVLNFLRFHDWIDVSKDGKRVWLRTEAKGLLSTPIGTDIGRR
jgi:hypothetical protein